MKHVLVVDDSAVVRKVTRRIVEGLDMRISEAEGCADAMQACAQEMPDAIIVDASLEDMKPLDFIRHVRSSPGGDAPRIIYCASENDVIHVAGAIRNGADLFMMKPFTKADLTSRLQSLGA